MSVGSIGSPSNAPSNARSSPPDSASARSRRITSPSPSVRHISARRVINRERQPLLEDHDNKTHLPPHILLELPGRGRGRGRDLHHDHGPEHASGRDADAESIVYQSQPMIHDPSSLNYLNPTSSIVPSDIGSNEYIPTHTQNFESLEWSEILPYYLPCFSWISQYCPSFLVGDIVGGLTLVFFQLPLSLSYATSLAKVPVISGLYSLGIAPLVYLVFGSVPQMVVGPEGPISLVVGQAVEPLLHHAMKKHLDPLEYVVAITFVSGASLLGFGLGRFGFLDNVLSASLLKGFISGVGIVMIINALVVVLGLEELQKEISEDPNQMDIHSPFDKVRFLIQNYDKFTYLSFKISVIGFVIIMGVRIFKKHAAKRNNPWLQRAVYIPEILAVVAVSTILCGIQRWDLEGIKIIGDVHNDDPVKLYNPIAPKMWPLIKSLGTSGFLCAMLGFFESTTASKSLGSTYDLPISSNRELVALGFINIIASMFGALPAFGGYGRSKINAISAKTTMLGAIMGLCTLFTISCLMEYLYYVPLCTLSVITAVIGISLIEEAPYELYFHWQSGGYNELITFGVTVTTTLFFSMEAGIAVGLIYSLIRVIKHLASSRIQILGRCPGTNNFVDADIKTSCIVDCTPHVLNICNSRDIIEHDASFSEKLKLKNFRGDYFSDDHFTQLNTEILEEIEGCLIIKIPEPLTFTNSNDLRTRLKRVEMYGSTKAHPALKRSRAAAMTKYIIFDLHGMTELDSSAAQILLDLLRSYRKREIRSFFVRVNKSQRLRKRLLHTGIAEILVNDLEDINYFDVQNKYTRSGRNRSINELENSFNLDASFESEITPLEVDEISEIVDLIESESSPYFNHISDALKVIDYYEVNMVATQDLEYA